MALEKIASSRAATGHTARLVGKIREMIRPRPYDDEIRVQMVKMGLAAASALPNDGPRDPRTGATVAALDAIDGAYTTVRDAIGRGVDPLEAIEAWHVDNPNLSLAENW